MTESAARRDGFSEPVNPWAGWARKAWALATVTGRRGPAPAPSEYPEQVRDLARQAARAPSLWRKIWTLWRIEGLTYACAHGGGEELRLADARLPLEAGPPAACGLSMAAVVEAGFDAGRVTRILEARADPRFIDFAFESLGLMLAAYEPDLFGRASGALGRLGLMRRHRLPRPEPASFVAGLPAERQGYAAHGFGRLLYFKRHSLRSVVAALSERPHVRRTPAVKGAVAAYVLVNGSRLPQVLSLAEADLPAELDEPIRGGLYNVVKLLAWALPTALDAVQPPGPRAAELLESAIREAADRRRSGEGPGLRS